MSAAPALSTEIPPSVTVPSNFPVTYTEPSGDAATPSNSSSFEGPDIVSAQRSELCEPDGTGREGWGRSRRGAESESHAPATTASTTTTPDKSDIARVIGTATHLLSELRSLHSSSPKSCVCDVVVTNRWDRTEILKCLKENHLGDCRNRHGRSW